MNTITTAFFPFTFISGQLAAKCYAFFGPVVVYQPAETAAPASMQELAKQGRLVLRSPVQGDDRHLADLARQYQSWGQVHQKHAAALKHFADAGFYNQEFVPEISSEILKGPKDKPEEPDPVFAARLFLLMAQEYDRQAAELENELAATDNTARQMFARIRGQGGQPGESSGFSGDMIGAQKQASEDPGAYMPEARIRAWLRLAQSDPDCPAIWLTSSPAVVAAVQEHFEPLVRLEQIPENVRQGLSDPSAENLYNKMCCYEMKDSGRVIGLLASAGP